MAYYSMQWTAVLCILIEDSIFNGSNVKFHFPISLSLKDEGNGSLEKISLRGRHLKGRDRLP